MEDSNLDDKDIVISLLIYPEDSNNNKDDPHEYPINPPSAETTPEPGTPCRKPTKELTSEPDYDALSEPAMSMR